MISATSQASEQPFLLSNEAYHPVFHQVRFDLVASTAQTKKKP